MLLVVALILLVTTVVVAEEKIELNCRNGAFLWAWFLPEGDAIGSFYKINTGRVLKRYGDQDKQFFYMEELEVKAPRFNNCVVLIGFLVNGGPEQRMAMFRLHDISYDGGWMWLAITQSDNKVTLQTNKCIEDSLGNPTGFDFKYPEDDLLSHPPKPTLNLNKKDLKTGDLVWYQHPNDGEGNYGWKTDKNGLYPERRFGGNLRWDSTLQLWRGYKEKFEYGAMVIASYNSYYSGDNSVIEKIHQPRAHQLIVRCFQLDGTFFDIKALKFFPSQSLVFIN